MQGENILDTMLTFFFLSGFSWGRFWHPGVTNIGGSNVNYIAPPDTGPITFIAALFIIAAFLFAALLFFRRKRLSRNTSFQSFVQTSVLIALIAGFRMDYNWAALYRDYSARFAGKNVDARIVELHGDRFYDFMKMVQGDVPEGETIRELYIDVNKNPRSYYMTIRGNYLLLPVTTSKKGRFIWAHPGLQNYRYVPDTSTLQLGGTVLKARLYKYYGEGRALFEIIDGGGIR